MALGKHNFVAHYAAGEIAKKLGNAPVYPTMPFRADRLTRATHRTHELCRKRVD
jgi:creatinine amidohydrolase/Fe(II)-dependent formamide hydrolase-like protein